MNLLTLMNIFSFLIQISLTTFVLVKNPKSSLNRVGSALIGCFGLWSFGAMFMGNHYIPKNVAMVCLNVIFCGAVGFMGLTPLFYLIFTDKKTILGKKIFSGIGLFFPLLFIYLQFGYQAIIRDLQEVRYGWTVVWSPSIWTYLYDFYYLFIIMTAFYLLIDFRKKTKSPIKKKHAMILIMTKSAAFVLGTTTDVLLPQLLKIHDIPVMGNIFVLIWIAGLVYAIARYRLFTVTLATAAENVISTISDCFILLDPQGTIQLVNKACPTVLRYTENELKGKPLTTLLPSNQASNMHLREMMRGKELKNFYLTLKAKNGAQVPASLSTSILRDEEGNIAGIVWIARDVTQHKLTEELLKEAEAKYSTFVERAKDGVAVVQDEVYQFVNRAMAEITGYTVQELLGRAMTELIAPEDRDMIRQRYRQRLAGEKVPSFYEAKFLARDGAIKSVELSAAVIQYNERPADMLVIRDITERKGAEEEKIFLSRETCSLISG